MAKSKTEWSAKVKKDGSAVRIYRYGNLKETIEAGKDNFQPAGATEFAKQLLDELYRQSAGRSNKKADHDVVSEPNLINDASGTTVTGKPSPSLSSMQEKVSKLQAEKRHLKSELVKTKKRSALEGKARRGAALAEKLVAKGSLPENKEAVVAFVSDIAQMTDEEIERIERKAAGHPEFTSIEEAERAERAYKREARMMHRKAEEAHESGDSETADKLDSFASDAEKNAECCRDFIRQAAHKSAEMPMCETCGKPKHVCNGCGEDKEASVEKEADHDVQEEPNLKNDAKGTTVTGKPSPSTNTKAGGDAVAKTAMGDDGCKECKCDPCECDGKKASVDTENTNEDQLVGDGDTKKASMETPADLGEQHKRMSKMYRTMADEAEERGDFFNADKYDHKASVCEDLARDAVVETTNPEPEIAGVVDKREAASEEPDTAKNTDQSSADAGDSNKDTDGSSVGSAKTASEDDFEIDDATIDAALTSSAVLAARSANREQRQPSPSRVDQDASGVTRIASVGENPHSHDDEVAALESLWNGAPGDTE